MRVPASDTEIDSRWLSEVLGVPIREVRTEDITAGRGVFGQIVRVHIVFDDGSAPRTVVVKLPTGNAHARHVATALRFYEREASFYAGLAAQLPLRVPQCLAAVSDPQSGRAALVLEDLSALRPGDQLVGLTEARAMRVVDALATMHAASWESPLLEASAHWLPRLSDPLYRDSVPEIFRSSWASTAERFRSVIDPDAAAIAARVAEDFESVLDRADRGPHSFVHSDVRLDNLLFDEADEPTFLDFQLSLRTHGTLDLVYLISTNVEPEHQQTLLPALLNRYHHSLVANGVRGYSFDDCWRHYREQTLYALVGAATIGADLSPSDTRGARLAETYVRRSLHHLLVSDAASVLSS